MEKNCFVASVMNWIKVTSQMTLNTSNLRKDKAIRSSTLEKQDRLLEILNVRSSNINTSKDGGDDLPLKSHLSLHIQLQEKDCRRWR